MPVSQRRCDLRSNGIVLDQSPGSAVVHAMQDSCMLDLGMMEQLVKVLEDSAVMAAVGTWKRFGLICISRLRLGPEGVYEAGLNIDVDIRRHLGAHRRRKSKLLEAGVVDTVMDRFSVLVSSGRHVRLSPSFDQLRSIWAIWR